MASPQVIEVAEWCDVAARHLDGVGGLPASEYARMVRDENLTVFAVFEPCHRVATILMRWEGQENGQQEAVIVAAGGKAEGNITLQTLPLLMDLARTVNSTSMRLHTKRPGLVRQVAHLADSREVVVSWSL